MKDLDMLENNIAVNNIILQFLNMMYDKFILLHIKKSYEELQNNMSCLECSFDLLIEFISMKQKEIQIYINKKRR